MKPEKVKSRWRRSSEMEVGEKSAPTAINKEGGSNDKQDKVENPDEKQSEVVKPVIDTPKNSIPEYVELEENFYLFERKRTKRKKEVRRMLCECTLTKDDRENNAPGCQDECLNRLLMIECGSRCPTGELCSNKRFQKRLYAKVVPFKTEKKGWGLKLLEDVSVGSFVIEYVGEVLSRQDFKQRVKQYAREKSNHYYFMALKTDEIIDATNKGNLSRFMNHSCDPNCETQKWTVNGELRIGFFAKRNLKSGEELTFDYQFQRYGREAQKCYCLSAICSGYIGVSNEISVDVSNKTVHKRKKGLEEKKREVMEDLILEEEIEKLCENGGLRTKDETLILSRLMVRAEDLHSRIKLLDIILGTSEFGCLRLFLDYHGLSLLWSWMVDVTSPKLQAKILEVLSLLPVPNKTMLLESKVFSVVERWASNLVVSPDHPGDGQHSSTDEKNFMSHAKKLKSCDTSDSETDGLMPHHHLNSSHSSEKDKNVQRGSSNNSELLPQYHEEGSVNSIITSDLEESSTAISDKNTDEESADMDDSDKCANNELMSMAQSLLSSWKDLKEVFRIPRREQKHRNEDYGFKRKQFMCKHCCSSGLSFCKHITSRISVTKEYNRFSKERNKDSSFHLQDKNFDQRTNELDERPRKVLLPTPVILTKEERRLQFEKEVLENDQRKALQKQQQYHDVGSLNGGTTENVLYSSRTEYCFAASNGSYCNSTTETFSFPAGENIHSFEQCYYNPNELVSRPVLLPTPGVVAAPNSLLNSEPQQTPDNSCTIYQPNMMFDSTHPPVPLLGVQPPPNIPQLQSSHVPPPTNLIVLTNANSSPIVPAVPPIAAETTSLSSVTHPILYNSLPGANQGFAASPLNSQYIAHQDQFSNQNGGFYPNQYPSHLVEQVSTAQPYHCLGNGDTTSKPVAVKLPPNWKTATDSEGNIYYYHILTRQTQWHPPGFDEVVDADGDTPTYDEPKEHKQLETNNHKSKKKHSKKSTTTAPADTSSNAVNSEIAKKIKELFRTKMSSFVVQILNPYHRDDCRIGRITSNEDFKHLARKLTHFVMAKELKHCKNVEDLECNENVKHKARDFIHKYMSKYGPLYRKEKNDSPYLL